MSAPPGRTLAAVLADGGLGSAALDLLRPVAGALDELHDDGLLHRGVRPDAIVVDDDGTATLQPLVPPAATPPPPMGASTVDATDDPVYLAPEQAGSTVASHRSDVYSFSCVVFEAITGSPPFTTSSLLEQVSGDVPSAVGRRADLPAAVDEVFRAALAVLPEARPPSASAVLDGLVEAFGGSYRPRAGTALRRSVVLAGALAVVALAFLVVAVVLTAGGP